MKRTIRNTLLAALLASSGALAQEPAKIVIPMDAWIVPDTGDVVFGVTPPGEKQPAFGVRSNGHLIFSYSAFVPEIPYHFKPADRLLGYIKATIGGQEILIPAYLPVSKN